MPSRFDRDTIREYFEHCQRTGAKKVGSIGALTEHAYKTGNNDLEIKEWLFPTSSVPMATCPLCAGLGKVPEPQQAEPQPCELCKDSKKFTVYIPSQDIEQEIACPRCFPVAPALEVGDDDTTPIYRDAPLAPILSTSGLSEVIAMQKRLEEEQ